MIALYLSTAQLSELPSFSCPTLLTTLYTWYTLWTQQRKTADSEGDRDMRYYHVADASYQAGDDLLCFNEQDARGWEPVWKWEEAEIGFDGDVVCLFESSDEAEDFIATWLPTGILLAVDIPEDYREWGLRMDHVSEGYPCVVWRIPAQFISKA